MRNYNYLTLILLVCLIFTGCVRHTGGEETVVIPNPVMQYVTEE